jgi:hypothetical protein
MGMGYSWVSFKITELFLTVYVLFRRYKEDMVQLQTLVEVATGKRQRHEIFLDINVMPI